MKNVLRFLSVVLFVLCSAYAQGAEQTKDYGWCSITCPDKVAVGQAFELKVTLKDIPAGLKVSGDIHLIKEDGSYGGFGQRGGKGVYAAAGQTVSVPYTMPAAKNGSTGITIQLYLSAGSWEQRVKDASSPSIMIDTAPAATTAAPAAK